MKTYVDSSVILRIVLGQPGGLTEWKMIRPGISSALMTTECLRSLDRIRLRHKLSDSEAAERRSILHEFLGAVESIEIDRYILERASYPMTTELGTLDAIHLATALVLRENTAESFPFATHDMALAIAARAHGFHVIGVPFA